MALKQQKIATRPLHTVHFYRMRASLIVFGLMVYVCCVSGDFHPGIFCFSGIVFSTAMTLVGFHTGKYVTPKLSSYTGLSYQRESNHIARSLVLSFFATILMPFVLAQLFHTGSIVGVWQLVAAIFFNIYGWFALGWWREVIGVIGTHPGQRRNNASGSMLPSSVNTGTFAESPVGMVVLPARDSSLQSMRIGAGKS